MWHGDGWLRGEIRPLEEHVSHDMLLRNGVVLIEYRANKAALTTSRIFPCCLPFKVADADGGPASVIALEDR